MTLAHIASNAPATAAAPRFVELGHGGARVRIETAWVGTADEAAPLIVFLHEGLGSVAMWKDFPEQLCRRAGCRGLVYSRPGYGRSTPRAPDDAWGPGFMHGQAHDVLPSLLEHSGVDTKADPPWLFGHSDGASIALLYAARFPDRAAGLVVLAPHIMVEDLSVHSIAQARQAYLDTDLKQRLAKYHDDPDSAFWGWNDAWLRPEFRSWSIEAELASLRCPVLAIQGLNDEYGTLEQIRGIARRHPRTELIELADCGHSPHRDQAEAVIIATSNFVYSQSRGIAP